MDAYEQLIPAGEQISYFIYFEVDPANIDVNIHPTKTEIKFENEQAIWQILSAAVKESLGKFNAVPSIDFDTEGMPDIPAFEQSRPMNRLRCIIMRTSILSRLPLPLLIAAEEVIRAKV